MKRVSLVLVVVAAGCGGGAETTTPVACDDYAACCLALEGPQQSTCYTTLDDARSAANQADGEASCNAALTQLRGLGYCQAVTGNGRRDMTPAASDCPDGLVQCFESCVDTSSDPNNCGACGVGAVTCSDGKPGCGPGETWVAYSWGWGCVDVATDAQNCGAVGYVCANEDPVGKLFECRGGKCGGRIDVVQSSSTGTNCIAECSKLGLNCDDDWFLDDSGSRGGTQLHPYDTVSDVYGCASPINPRFDNAECGCIKGDPCGDFQCVAQAQIACVSDTTFRSYQAVGTCSLGVCTFTPTDTECPHGCDGVGSLAHCSTNPCGLVSCNSPPPPTCLSATALRSYASNGTCSGGTCSYTSTDSACNSPPSVCYHSAGSCANGQCSYTYADGVSCNVGGVCKSGLCLCTPSCGGKDCGADGCGGSCGFCGVGELCSSGGCVTDPNYCDPVTNTGCANSNQCLIQTNETTRCALAGSGTDGSACSATVTCAGGYGCFSGTCRHLCNSGDSSDCAPGEMCNSVSGWFKYGFCK